MKNDKASNPIAIRLLGANAVVFDADPVTNAIEQQHRRNVRQRMGRFGPRIAHHNYDSLGLRCCLPSANWPILVANSGESAPFLSGVFAGYFSLGRTNNRALET